MTIYFVYIAILVLLGGLYARLRLSIGAQRCLLFVFFLASLLVFGFRYRVGVDWGNYVVMYNRYITATYFIDTSIFDSYEFLYRGINLISHYYDWGIIGVIFISTAIFLYCTIYGAYRLNINPFYFMAITAPYHFVISGMNFTRQALAISVFIYALPYLLDKKYFFYCITIVIASLFHQSALALLAFACIGWDKKYLLVPLILVIPLLYYLANTVYGSYLDSSFSNAGFALRIGFVLAVSSLIWPHLGIAKDKSFIFYRACLASIMTVPMMGVMAAMSTTMADRFTYYFIVFSAALLLKLVDYKPIPIGSPYLRAYIAPASFITSMVAFLVWLDGSTYASSYIFHYYWLN